MSKNGYEVRLEVLKQAVSLADSQYCSKVNAKSYEETSGSWHNGEKDVEDDRVSETLRIAKEFSAFVDGGH